MIILGLVWLCCHAPHLILTIRMVTVPVICLVSLAQEDRSAVRFLTIPIMFENYLR